MDHKAARRSETCIWLNTSLQPRTLVTREPGRWMTHITGVLSRAGPEVCACMPSERIQRRIDAFLDHAEEASDRRDWPAVAELARAVLAKKQIQKA